MNDGSYNVGIGRLQIALYRSDWVVRAVVAVLSISSGHGLYQRAGA